MKTKKISAGQLAGLVLGALALLVVGFLLGTRTSKNTVELSKTEAAKTTVAAPTTAPTAVKGNGSPSGSHFNLNLIGVPKEKSASMTNNDGRRIFVPLTGSCQIKLAQGTFQVLDANCTDGTGQFQLPNPDPDNDGITTYSVWARALGKPGGSSETTTCATDPTDGLLYCSIYSMVQVREKGKSTFDNVSKQLLYVFADIDGDGTVDRMPLFDDRLQDYYWQYDNNGLKNVQLRFYEIPTNVN